jgi:hypothetical protein
MRIHVVEPPLFFWREGGGQLVRYLFCSREGCMPGNEVQRLFVRHTFETSPLEENPRLLSCSTHAVRAQI